MTKRRISASVLFSVSLFLLFNPNINLIDPLPDFIGYTLMILAIGAASSTVPYLEECKSALGILALVSAARIPACIMMYNNLGTGRDIVPMFTLIFVAVESILLWKATENGYKALCYISERTDASTVTEPFKIGKNGRTMTVLSLRILTYIFLAGKQILNLAPELLLLTTEETEIRKKLREAYPTVLIVCIFAACIIGIIWVVYAKKYVKSLSKSNKIAEAISSIEIIGTPEEQKRESRMKSYIFALNILVLSSLFSFDLTFSDFGEVNILPHFIYGLFLFYAIFNLLSDKKKRIWLTICTAVFVVSSIITHLFTTRFLDKYDYLFLLYSSAARKLYLPIKITAVIEAAALISLLVISAFSFVDFIKENTGTHPSSEMYGVSAKKNHLSLIRRSCVLFSLSGLIGVLKCLDVFLKADVKIAFTEVNTEGFATSALPWMGTLIFALCIIYVLYSFYFIHDVKSEVRFKFGFEK